MADGNTTFIRYDTAEAIQSMHKLQSRIDAFANDAVDAFKKVGKESSKLDEVLSHLPPSFSKAAQEIGNLFSILDGSTPAIDVATTLVGSLAGNLLDLQTILRDTTANYKAFISAVESVRQQQEIISSFGDAADNRDTRLAARVTRIEQAETNLQKNLIEAERDAARQRLGIVQDEIRRRESIVKDGIKREEDLRKKLADRNETNAADSFGGPAGKRTLDLTAAASKAAFEGNIDLAEELLDAAKKQSEELGNHSLFLRAIDTANDDINRSLEKQIQNQSNINDVAESDLAQIKQLESALKKDIEGQNQKLRALTRQNRELEAQLKLINDIGIANRAQQQADRGARGVQAAATTVNEFFRVGPSFLEEFSKVIDSVQQAVTGRGVKDQQAIDTLQAEAIKELAGFGELAARVNRGEGVTAGEIEKLIPSLDKVGRLGEILEIGRKQGRIPEGSQIDKDVTRLQDAIDQVFKFVNEAGRFREQRGDDTAIQRGSEGPTRDDMRALRDSLLNLNRTIESQPSRAAAAVPASAGQGQTQGAPVPATNATSSNITVNANVKGGIIDAEVTREITRIIRQELRKQTSAAPTA